MEEKSSEKKKKGEEYLLEKIEKLKNFLSEEDRNILFNEFSDKKTFVNKLNKICSKHKFYNKKISKYCRSQLKFMEDLSGTENYEHLKINDDVLINYKIMVFNNTLNQIKDFINNEKIVEQKHSKKRKIEELYDIEEISNIIKEKDVKFPNEYLCPISKEIMKDPVIDELGNTYDRYSITKWFVYNNTSPLTNQRVTTKHLTPNNVMKNMIVGFLDNVKKQKM